MKNRLRALRRAARTTSCTAALVAPLLAMAPTAHASLTISSGTTANVTCNSGVCTATAKKAVLNVGQLQSLLGSSSVKVVPGKKAGDIVVSDAVTWASSNGLTLDAYTAIAIDKTISVNGPRRAHALDR